MESQGGSASVLIGMLVTLREELARVQSENRRLRELLESTATGRMLIAEAALALPASQRGGRGNSATLPGSPSHVKELGEG